MLLRHHHDGLLEGKSEEFGEPECPHCLDGDALLGAGAELHDADQPQGSMDTSSH